MPINSPLARLAYLKKALYLPSAATADAMTHASADFVAFLNRYDQGVDETALRHLNALGDDEIALYVDIIRNVTCSDLNWASLILHWNEKPVDADWTDYFVTYLCNTIPGLRHEGVTLPCGHFIPEGVFDLTRYTGCPYCGTSFVSAKANFELHVPQDVELLVRWTEADAEAYARRLLSSKVPLDATQTEHLDLLLQGLPFDFFTSFGPIPAVETRAQVACRARELYADGRFTALCKTPDDMLRTLWAEKTGTYRFLDYKKALKDKMKLSRPQSDATRDLRLHFDRATCRAVARWFDALPQSAELVCEGMHARRGMWVRFIRALRLPEYARRYKLDHLAEILDRFYRGDYSVWAGEVDRAAAAGDTERLLGLLSDRPGAFARRLFDTILDHGITKNVDFTAFFDDPVLSAFRSLWQHLPVRLIISLLNAVPDYFDPHATTRIVTAPHCIPVELPVNPGLQRVSREDRRNIACNIVSMLHGLLGLNYASCPALPGSAVYISPELYRIPAPVGDRGTTVAVKGHAVPGQSFPVEGDRVRLFLHWGVGMAAQHYDMDLSCCLISPGRRKDIAYYSLNEEGANHSGDIQHIPDQTGAAEYIELDLPVLAKKGYKYAVFTANAYSMPTLATDLLFGWMSSERPMKVDDDSGAAYNPADVEQMVTLSPFHDLDRGMVYAILDIEARTILWVEMANDNQRLDQLNLTMVEAIRRRLEGKISVGELIRLYADAHHQPVVSEPAAGATVYAADNWPAELL